MYAPTNFGTQFDPQPCINAKEWGVVENIMKQTSRAHAPPGNHFSSALLAHQAVSSTLESQPCLRQAEAGFYQLGRHGFELKLHSVKIDELQMFFKQCSCRC